MKPSNFIVIKKTTKPQGASKSSVTEEETPGEGVRRGRGRKEGREGGRGGGERAGGREGERKRKGKREREGEKGERKREKIRVPEQAAEHQESTRLRERTSSCHRRL